MNLKSWKWALALSAAVLLSLMIVRPQQVSATTISIDEKPEAVEVERITVDELKSKMAKNDKIIIIDVRGADYDASTTKIKGAIRIAPGEVEAHLKDLPRDKEIITYCACSTDGGSVKAAQILLAHGFKHVHALKGGWNAWNEAGGAVEPK